MVAQLMIPFLQDGTKTELKRLLGDQWERDIVSHAASVEAELLRPRNSHLLPLQLTLFEPGDEAFKPETHCPDNACSVAAILESRLVLLQARFSDVEKKTALTYLMHYMLQMHVPVNSGLKRDQGGQKIYLKDSKLQLVNFSWIWNYDLYRLQQKHWFAYAQELYRKMEDMDITDWQQPVSVQDWVFETHQIAINDVYPFAAKGRYSAELQKNGEKVLELQLMKAAVRTAAILNEIFPGSAAEM